MTRSGPTTLFVSALLTAGLVVACQPSPEPTLDELPSELDTIEARKIAEFGCPDCAGPELLDRVRHISVSDDGTAFAVCATAPYLRRFDFARAGGNRPPAQFGAHGEGPGELSVPAYVFSRNDGTILVYNALPGRATIYDADTLETLDTHILPSAVPTNAAYDARGDVVAIASMSPIDGAGTAVRLWRVGELEPQIVLRPGVLPGERSDRSKHRFPLAIGPGGPLAVGFSWDYLIRFFDAEGVQLAEMGRDIPRSTKTERELLAEQDAAKQFRDMVGGGARVASVVEEKHHFSRFSFDFDSGGRLWVLTYRGDDQSSVFDVFDPSEGYLGAVTVPANLRERNWQAGNVFDIQGRYLAGVVVDESHNESLIVFELGAH